MINMVQMKINGEIILFLNEQPNVTSDPMLTQFLRKVAWQRPAFLTKRLHRHLYLDRNDRRSHSFLAKCKCS